MKPPHCLIIIFLLIACPESYTPQDAGRKYINDEAALIVDLWPEGTEGINKSIAELIKPQGKRFYNIHNPTLTIYKPESSNGVAVIICPGGGYSYVASGVEGGPTARILNKFGITVFVLKYRLPTTPGVKFKHPVPLLDALRAIQYVRYNAERYNIDAGKIGIMGFSAGGHLASMAGTLYNQYSFGTDEVAKMNSRPDFMCLVYPVISIKDSLVYKGIVSLVDTSMYKRIPSFLSSELNVTRNTPPAFLVHAKDDQSVNYNNSVVMFNALREKGIPTELKLYSEGGHGFGVGREGTDSANWLNDFIEWLSKRKYLPTGNYNDL